VVSDCRYWLSHDTGPAWAAEPEANKQLYRSYIEDMWTKRNPSAADRYLAPNFIEHNQNLPPGLEGRKQFVASVIAGFSDYHAEIQDVLAEGGQGGCPGPVDWNPGRTVPWAAGHRQKAALFHGRLLSHRQR